MTKKHCKKKQKKKTKKKHPDIIYVSSHIHEMSDTSTSEAN